MHKRHRLVDADNLCIKGFLDGIVLKGILSDDNAKVVNSITQQQEVAANETTIITITPAGK